MKALRQAWVIAKVEWLLQVRSPVFWAAWAVLLVYTLAQGVGGEREMINLPRVWLGSRDDALSWLAIGLVFLVPSAFIRDHRKDFIWTTPIDGHIYAAGKLLGLWMTAFTLEVSELATQFLLRAPTWPEWNRETLHLFFSPLGRTAVVMLFLTAFFALISALTKERAILAYMGCSIYFVAVLGMKDIANPLTISSFPVFRSDLIGNGPEEELFRANTFLYLGLMLAISAMIVMVYPRRERRSSASGALLPVMVAILFAGLLLAGKGGGDLVRVWRRVTISPVANVPSPSLLGRRDVDQVFVKAQVTPASGLVEGEVRLVFTGSRTSLVLRIPRGLIVTSVTDCEGRSLPSRRLGEGDWGLQVTGDFSQICVDFWGRWWASREQYERYPSPENMIRMAGAYVGSDYAYIAPGAWWYPAPVGSYKWESPHIIEIEVPQGVVTLVSPIVAGKPNGGGVLYRWESEQGSPLVTLVAGDYRMVTPPGGNVLWVAPEHAFVAEQAVDFYRQFLRPMGEFVGVDELPRVFVETPLLRWPLATPDVILLPEGYFLDQLNRDRGLQTGYEVSSATRGADYALLRESYYVVRGWLLGQAAFIDSAFMNRWASFEEMPAEQADLLSSYVPLREVIAHYLGAQIASQEVGKDLLSERLEEHMRIAEEASDASRENSQYIVGLSVLPIDIFENAPAFNHLFAAFGQLEQLVGRERVNRMIELLLQTHQGKVISLQDWLAVIEDVAGVEARQSFEMWYPIEERE